MHASDVDEVIFKKENNERKDYHTYEGFFDEEILYYYLNRQTHLDQEKHIKDKSRTLYARDLSQFYFFIKQSTEFLQQEVKDFKDGQVWKLEKALYSKLSKVVILRCNLLSIKRKIQSIYD